MQRKVPSKDDGPKNIAVREMNNGSFEVTVADEAELVSKTNGIIWIRTKDGRKKVSLPRTFQEHQKEVNNGITTFRLH